MLLYLCDISAAVSVDPYEATRQQACQVDPQQFSKVLTSKDLQAILPVHLQAQRGRKITKLPDNIHDPAIPIKLLTVLGH